VTEMGRVMGTPAYMPPEQARGEIDRLDERCDVFSLGAILTQILTEKPPYLGPTGWSIVEQATRGDLAPCLARLDACGADQELIGLAKACLQVDPANRPRDANVVAQRVTDYLRSVESRLRAAEMERVAQTARAEEERKRRRVTLALATSVVLLLSLASGSWMWIQSTQSQRRAVATAKFHKVLNAAQLHRGLADAGELASQQAELEKGILNAEEAVDLVRLESLPHELREGATQLLAELQERSDNVRRQIEQAASDKALQNELEMTRLSQADGGDTNRGNRRAGDSQRMAGYEYFDITSAAERYAQAFEQAGLDVPALATSDLAARVERSAIRESLIAALDNWARSVPHPTLKQFHDAYSSKDWEMAIWSGGQIVKQTPGDAETWLKLAPLVVLAGGDAAYRPFCERMARQFAPSTDSRQIEQTLKSCLLRPDAVELSVLPREQLVAALDGATVSRDLFAWFWFARGLLEFRSGDAKEALRCLDEAEENRPNHFAKVEILALRAMARQQLGQVIEARGDLRKAEESLALLTKDVRNRCDHDLLISRILLDEAQTRVGEQPIGSWKPQLGEAAAAALTSEVPPSSHTDAVRDEALRSKLFDVADAADSSDWRRTVRAALRSNQSQVLRELSTSDEARRQSPELIAWLGQALRGAGEVQASIELLRNAQDAHRGDFWLNYELSESLVRRGESVESVGFARAALAQRPESSGALWTLAKAIAAAGKADESLRLFRQLIDRLSQDEGLANRAAWCTDLGVSFSRKGQWDDAIAAYRTAISISPKAAGAYINLGVDLAKLGKLDEAVEALRTAAKLNPTDVISRSNLGEILRRQGKTEEAITEFQAALALDPSDAVGRVNYGIVLWDVGRSEEALVEFRAAISLDPQDLDARLSLGNVLSAQEKFDEAAAAYRAAIEVHPESATAHLKLGFVFQRQGKLAESNAEYRLAIELDPKTPFAQTNLALNSLVMGKFEEGVVACRAAIEADPKSSDAYGILGALLGNLEKMDEAIVALRKAGELDPNNFSAWMNLGAVCRSQGKFEEAITAFQAILKLNPEDAETEQQLLRAYAALGRWKEAIELGRGQIEKKPKDSEAWLRLAPILIQSENDAAYRELTAGMLKQFGGTKDPQMAERMCKACLLLADGVDVTLLPKATLENALDKGTPPDWLLPWAWFARGLLAYRSGDAKSAIDAVNTSLGHQPNDNGLALNYALRSLAKSRLEQNEGAQADLEKARKAIDRLLADFNNHGHHDLLIAQILLREAEAQVNKQSVDGR
ncbi:MAG: tetratricopeptide repeat protein, partial [Planctomycetota bacterium]|nr:tetratricopeptide repeat protein [Planctomycetota bacterium]